jgi:CHAT domain-containing protein/Tfp pilus assembly protein PilF
MPSVCRLALCLVFLSLAINSFAQNQLTIASTDETAIKSVITQLFQAYTRKDLTAIKALWTPKSPDFEADMKQLQTVFANAGDPTARILSFDKISLDGIKATVRVQVKFSGEKFGTEPDEVHISGNRVLSLTKESDGWKILRHISAEKDLALRLLNAKNEVDRDQLLAADKELVNANLTRAITSEGDRIGGSVPPSEVMRVFRLGQLIAERLGDKGQIAEALNGVGTALYSQSKSAEALEIYQQGIGIATEIGDDDLAARILGNMGTVYMFNLDDHLKGRGLYQKSFVLAEKVGNKKVMGSALSNIATSYLPESDYVEALRFAKRALALFEQIGEVGRVAGTTMTIGLIHLQQGNSAESIPFFNKSFELHRSVNDKRRMATVLWNLGLAYEDQADYAKSMATYQRSLAISEEINYTRGIAGVLVNVGRIYGLQGDYDQALSVANKALALSESINSKYLKGISLSAISAAYARKSKYEEAIRYRKLSLAIAEEIGEKQSVSNGLNSIGYYYLELRDYERSIEYLQRALSVSEPAGDRWEIVDALTGIAKVQFLQRNYLVARETAERAKKYAGTGEIPLSALMAQIYEALGDHDMARRSVEEAIRLIEVRRTHIVGGPDQQQKFSAKRASSYHLMIDLLISQNHANDALDYAERGKSRALLDVLQNGKFDYVKALSLPERELEQRMMAELSSVSTQISQEESRKQPDETRVSELKNELDTKRLELDELRIRLYASHPELRVQRGEMKPIGLTETAGLLPGERGALVEYAVGEDKTFIFVITKDAAQKPSLKVYPIDIKQKDLAERVEVFRSNLAKGDPGFSKEAGGLYDLLVKPAAEQLAGKTNIVIVPDGPLWNLPFQALQPSMGKYLIEQAAVSYAPSLTALREMQKKNHVKKITNAALLAFGNPAVNKETSDKLKSVFMDESLEPLPDAERLVNTLGKMYGPGHSKVYTGAAAREETAKTESPKFRIVQFATHGILNNVSPMYSHLVLAQDEKDPNEDGLLEAWEMKDLDLKADMVILSACDTARGKISNGEGVIGMTWAMFIAGTPTTVASQWKVESSSTTELMLEFHHQLLAGKVSKAEALRLAELKLLRTEKYKHPVYWAGFVLVGDGF